MRAMVGGTKGYGAIRHFCRESYTTGLGCGVQRVLLLNTLTWHSAQSFNAKNVMPPTGLLCSKCQQTHAALISELTARLLMFHCHHCGFDWASLNLLFLRQARHRRVMDDTKLHRSVPVSYLFAAAGAGAGSLLNVS